MAIAALVAHSMPGGAQGLLEALRSCPAIVDCQLAGEGRIAAALEAPSDGLLGALELVEKLPGLVNLELAYVNYEDDIGADGAMPCPPLSQIHKKSG